MLIAEALHHVAEESSTWLRADIARHLAILIPTGSGATATEVVARIHRLATEAADRCLGLAPVRPSTMARRRDGRPVGEHVTDRRLTTGAVLDQEIGLQRWAEQSACAVAPSLLDPQTAAAAAIAGTAPLVMVVGPAGTGKPRSTDLPVVSGFLRALNGFLVPERAWLLRGRVEAGLVSLLGW